MIRRLLPPLIAIAVIFGLIRLYRVAQRYDPSVREAMDRSAGAAGDVSIQFGDALIVNRTGGRRQWSLEAKQIDLRRPMGGGIEQLSTADFRGIKNGTLYREGKPESFFAADSARFDQSAQRFDIRGGIRFHNTKGDQVASEFLQWSERDDFVRFPQGASGKIRGNTIKTPMLLYHARKRTLDCPQGAEGIFNGYPARATKLFWDIGKEIVEFQGVSGARKGLDHFQAESATLNLKTRDLIANKASLELRIEGETPDLELFR